MRLCRLMRGKALPFRLVVPKILGGGHASGPRRSLTLEFVAKVERGMSPTVREGSAF